MCIIGSIEQYQHLLSFSWWTLYVPGVENSVFLSVEAGYFLLQLLLQKNMISEFLALYCTVQSVLDLVYVLCAADESHGAETCSMAGEDRLAGFQHLRMALQHDHFPL